jgi:hypothetical protein
MDTATSVITIALSICIVLFGIVAVVAALYGILVWYPAQRKKRVESLKSTGRQGEGTIIRLPKHELGPQPGRGSVFTMVPIGLEIRIPGMDPYEVDKVFTFPTHALGLLEEGKVVAVWVDPKQPRNLDKIVIDVK